MPNPWRTTPATPQTPETNAASSIQTRKAAPANNPQWTTPKVPDSNQQQFANWNQTQHPPVDKTGGFTPKENWEDYLPKGGVDIGVPPGWQQPQRTMPPTPQTGQDVLNKFYESSPYGTQVKSTLDALTAKQKYLNNPDDYTRYHAQQYYNSLLSQYGRQPGGQQLVDQVFAQNVQENIPERKLDPAYGDPRWTGEPAHYLDKDVGPWNQRRTGTGWNTLWPGAGTSAITNGKNGA